MAPLPEGHAPVCRPCYNNECENCATGRLRGTEMEKWFRKCECDCDGNEYVKRND